MTIEIGMPLYRPSGRLEAVLLSLAKQTYLDFYITMYNDTNPSEIEEIEKDQAIVAKMVKEHGLKINLIQNDHNLGYMKNMHQIFERATGDILFLLADDDIVSFDCMELCAKAFLDNKVGVLTRPYYWFESDMRRAVRFEGKQYNEIQFANLSENPNYDLIWDCMRSAGQLSGLAFRMSYLKKGYLFVEDMFTAHIYPFLNLFADYTCAYMPHPTIAVSISTSQCHSDIYDPSPTQQWLDLYDNILKDEKYNIVHNEMKHRLMRDYLGFAQIKNYGTWKELFAEISVFIKNDKKNLFLPKFWIFALGSIIIPRKILINMIKIYKEKILGKKLKKIKINYGDFPIEEVEELWSKPKEGERNR